MLPHHLLIYNRFMTYLTKNDWSSCQMQIDELAKPDASPSWAAYCSSLVYNKQNNPRKAYASLAKACRLDRQSALWQKNRIIHLKLLQKYRLAYRAWQRYARLFDPLSIEDFGEMVNMAILAQDLGEAHQILLQAIGQYPSEKLLWDMLVSIELRLKPLAMIEASLARMALQFGIEDEFYQFVSIKVRISLLNGDNPDLEIQIANFHRHIYPNLDQPRQAEFDLWESEYFAKRANLSCSCEDEARSITLLDNYYDKTQDQSAYCRNLLQRYRLWEKTVKTIAVFDLQLLFSARHEDANHGLGFALSRLNLPSYGQLFIEKSIQLRPHNPDYHLNLALMKLHLGNYRKGFTELAWRWSLVGDNNGRAVKFRQEIPCPVVNHLDEIKEKPLLLYGEQGAGDFIQFLRFVPRIARIASHIRMVADAVGLVGFNRLLAHFPGITVVNQGSEIIGDVDYQASLWDLPHLLGIDKLNLDSPIKFPLEADWLSSWREKIEGVTAARNGSSQNPLKVGFVYKGGEGNPLNRLRSFRLDDFIPIIEAFPHIQFFCLQKIISAEDKAILREFSQVTIWDEAIEDFADTATLIEFMDLVISVDTSVGHLAANQGKPTWILTAWHNDWRWGIRESHSPWYPSAQIFHQPRQQGWAGLRWQLMRHLARFEQNHLPASQK